MAGRQRRLSALTRRVTAGIHCPSYSSYAAAGTHCPSYPSHSRGATAGRPTDLGEVRARLLLHRRRLPHVDRLLVGAKARRFELRRNARTLAECQVLAACTLCTSTGSASLLLGQLRTESSNTREHHPSTANAAEGGCVNPREARIGPAGPGRLSSCSSPQQPCRSCGRSLSQSRAQRTNKPRRTGREQAPKRQQVGTDS